jgi:malate dehydrogenase
VGVEVHGWRANHKPRFAESVLKAHKGEKGIVEPTFVYLPGVPGGKAIAEAAGVDFFSVPVELGVGTI